MAYIGGSFHSTSSSCLIMKSSEDEEETKEREETESVQITGIFQERRYTDERGG